MLQRQKEEEEEFVGKESLLSVLLPECHVVVKGVTFGQRKEVQGRRLQQHQILI